MLEEGTLKSEDLDGNNHLHYSYIKFNKMMEQYIPSIHSTDGDKEKEIETCGGYKHLTPCLLDGISNWCRLTLRKLYSFFNENPDYFTIGGTTTRICEATWNIVRYILDSLIESKMKEVFEEFKNSRGSNPGKELRGEKSLMIGCAEDDSCGEKKKEADDKKMEKESIDDCDSNKRKL